MKRTIQASILAALLFGGAALAAETEAQIRVRTCEGWNRQPPGEKTAFTFGWLMGIMAADDLTRDIIMDQLWPKGYRVGGVEIEINVICQEAGNRSLFLEAVIKRIAKEKNAL